MEVVVKLEEVEEERPCTELSPEKEDDKKINVNTFMSIETQTDVKLGNIDHRTIWRRRSTLVNQIFSKVTSRKQKSEENKRCKKIGLDLNVGSGPKPKLDLKLLTNGVMKEIAEFAKEMSTNSQKHYIAEILEYNFYINFENSKQRREFAHQTWQRVVEMHKRQKQYPDDVSMLNEPWMLSIHPYHMFPKTSSQINPIRDSEIKSEHLGFAEICGESESDMMTNQDIKVETFYTVSEETRVDPYPLCKEIGLDLDVTCKGWSKEKLGEDVLTKGVMIEVAKYTKELCGTYRQIVFDILEHNFDLDLQAVDSELFRSIISGIGLIRLKKNKTRNVRAWYETAFSLHIRGKREPKLAPASRQSERQKKRQLSATHGVVKKIDKVSQSGGTREKTCLLLSAAGGRVSCPAPPLTPSYDTHTTLCGKEVKLRDSNYMRARFDYYPFCEQSGIDLDVYSKLEPKDKRDLRLLTNGVMYEIRKYVRRNRKKRGYSRFLFDILDYNFDLSFHNQTWYTFSQRSVWAVQRMAKTYHRDLAISPNHATDVFALHSKMPTERKKRDMVTQPARTSERIFKKTCKLSNVEKTNLYTEGTTDLGQVDDLGFMCPLEDPDIETLVVDEANLTHIKMESN